MIASAKYPLISIAFVIILAFFASYNASQKEKLKISTKNYGESDFKKLLEDVAEKERSVKYFKSQLSESLAMSEKLKAILAEKMQHKKLNDLLSKSEHTQKSLYLNTDNIQNTSKGMKRNEGSANDIFLENADVFL